MTSKIEEVNAFKSIGLSHCEFAPMSFGGQANAKLVASSTVLSSQIFHPTL